MRCGIAVLALAGVGCRSEFVIGVLEQHASSEGSSTTGETSTSAGTTMVGSETSSADATSSSSSSSGPSCAEEDDGDASDTTGAAPMCMAPTGHSQCDQNDNDPFHALGLGCMGGATETVPISATATMGDPSTLAVVTRFGADGNAHWVPSEGSKLVVLTTGILDLVGDHAQIPLGRTYADDGDNPNGDGDLPTPIVPLPGEAPGPCAAPFVGCDGEGDCSDSVPAPWDEGGGVAHDLAWLRFDVAVPAGTFGWRVDLAWLTAEFPEAADAAASDFLIWWVSSEAYTGNVATIGEQAITVANIGQTIADQGFVAPPWLTLSGPAHPGETMTSAVAIFDVGDANIDSLVLLDNWRWHCEGCTAGDDCGIGPRVAE